MPGKIRTYKWILKTVMSVKEDIQSFQLETGLRDGNKKLVRRGFRENQSEFHNIDSKFLEEAGERPNYFVIHAFQVEMERRGAAASESFL